MVGELPIDRRSGERKCTTHPYSANSCNSWESSRQVIFSKDIGMFPNPMKMERKVLDLFLFVCSRGGALLSRVFVGFDDSTLHGY